MKILVQTNRRNESQLLNEFKIIEDAGYIPVPYGYVVQNNGDIKITGLEDLSIDELCFNRASIQILRYYFIEKRNFIGCIPTNFFTSLYYDEQLFKISNMNPSIDNINLSPDKHGFISLKDALHLINETKTFYKPNNDRKLIPGTIVEAGHTLFDSIKDCYNFTEDQLNELLLYSTNCNISIDEEIRCFIVDNKFITASRYRCNNKYDTTQLMESELEYYKHFAIKYVNSYYSPGEIFTIDLVRSGDKVYIMEYNCLNSSGMYSIDGSKLFKSIENKLKNK